MAKLLFGEAEVLAVWPMLDDDIAAIMLPLFNVVVPVVWLEGEDGGGTATFPLIRVVVTAFVVSMLLLDSENVYTLMVPLDKTVETTDPLDLPPDALLITELNGPGVVVSDFDADVVLSNLVVPLLISFEGMPLGVDMGPTMIEVLEEVIAEPAGLVVVTGKIVVDSEHGQDTTMVFVIVALDP